MTQDKEADVSGVAEAKDAPETVSEKGKGPEESTPQTDKETKQGDDDVKSEECSSESKVDGIDKQQDTEARSPEDIEKVFASKTQERLIGLLGAVLPQDSKVQIYKSCIQLSLPAFCCNPVSPNLFSLWSYTRICRQETTHSNKF